MFLVPVSIKMDTVLTKRVSPSGDRTHDLKINSLALCLLSYQRSDDSCFGTHCTKIVGSQPSPDEAAQPTLAAHNNAWMGGSWCYLMVAQGRAMETVQGKQDKPIIIVGNASLCQEAD